MACLCKPQDYRNPLTSIELLTQVSRDGSAAFKNRIRLDYIKLLWEKLGTFVRESISARQSIGLPKLGSFKVGISTTAEVQRWRPTFSLLPTPYRSVALAKPTYIVEETAPVAGLDYKRLSVATVLHPAVCKALVAELMQCLGRHILSGRPIKVEFPSVGVLATNGSGSISFVFDSLLLKHVELGNFPFTDKDPPLTKSFSEQVKAKSVGQCKPESGHDILKVLQSSTL
eukprot:gene7901-1112_t